MTEATYYGAPVDATVKTIGERLRDLYDPEDFVTVINVDTKPIKYQFTSPSDIETFSNHPGHKNTIQKRPPQVVTLQPGDTKLCPAYEADHMLETLVKQIAMNRLNSKVESGELTDRSASFDWTDPYFQQNILKEAFVGKKDILNAYNAPVDVSKDLELDESPKVGRPRKEV